MKALIGFVVVAVIGVAAYLLFFSGSAYGVSGDHPLGTYEAIAQYFQEERIDPKPYDEQHLRWFFGDEIADRPGVTATVWHDLVPNFPHFVVVVRDASGKLIAAGGQFRSAMFEYSTVGVRSMHLVSTLWKDVTGGEPIFLPEQFGAQAGQDRMRATVRKGRVTGTWIKDWGGGMKIAHQVTDRVVLVLE